MQIGDLSIEDVVRLGLVCFGAAAASYVTYTAGYFSLLGPEFIGIYFDGNLLSGIVQITPAVAAVISMSVVTYYYIYMVLSKFDEGGNIIEILLIMDKLIFIPVLIAFFLDGYLLVVKSAVFFVSAFVIAGVVFFQYWLHGAINYLNVVFLIFTLYNAIDYSGKAAAYEDLTKGSPRYSLYTSDKNYANVVVLRSTDNGVIIKSGRDIVFYANEKIIKMERDVRSIKQFSEE